MGSVAPFRRRLRGVAEFRRPQWRRASALPSLRTLLFAAVVGAIGYYGFSSGTLSEFNPLSGNFGSCRFGWRANCVVDGDTFIMDRQKIRIADIDAPEIVGACDYERTLARRATVRLRELLNEGPFELRAYASRDTDQYGRKLRMLYRGGRSIGDVLIAEGLARRWTGRRQPWCV
jgi:micrococcal nuclease